MAEESNASLSDVVALLKRQVEQADSSAKRAEDLASEERRRLAKRDSQRVRVSRLLALLLVTVVLALGVGVIDRHAIQSLTAVTPAEYVRKQIDNHQKLSFASSYILLLILGGLYFAIVDLVASVLRRLFMSEK